MTTLTSQQAPRLSLGVQIVGSFVLVSIAVAATMLVMSPTSEGERIGTTFSVPPVEQALQSRALNGETTEFTRTQTAFDLGAVEALRSLNGSEAVSAQYSVKWAIETRSLNRPAASPKSNRVQSLVAIGHARALNQP